VAPPSPPLALRVRIDAASLARAAAAMPACSAADAALAILLVGVRSCTFLQRGQMSFDEPACFLYFHWRSNIHPPWLLCKRHHSAATMKSVH